MPKASSNQRSAPPLHPRARSFRARSIAALGSIPAVLLAFAAPAASFAQSDTFVDRANALYQTIPEAARSDRGLLSALAAMDAPPGAIQGAVSPDLMPASAESFAELVAWANAPNQRAILDELAKAVTQPAGGAARGFGLRYGIGEATPELVAKGLYVELGDPPLLARAQFLYLDSIKTLTQLVHIEITSLQAQAKPVEALRAATQLVLLGRQLVDREFAAEVALGYQIMTEGVRRIRDIVYVDSTSGSPQLGELELKRQIDALAMDQAPLIFDRLRFPSGNLIAAEQVIDQTFGPRPGDGPNDAFALLVAGLSTSGQPLRLFGELPAAQRSAQAHADRLDSLDKAKRADDDLKLRWRLPNTDPQLLTNVYVRSLDDARHMVVKLVFSKDATSLRPLRHVLEAEIIGTQQALAMVAFKLRNNAYPPSLAALRPRYLGRIDDDPFNREREVGGQPWMGYFVPKLINVPAVGPRETPQPHRANIVMSTGQNFSVTIDSDQFVLYSSGPDGRPNRAGNVREEALEQFPGDYLIWPPARSLYRNHLKQTGVIK